jgi:16S rRNA processing protein RimM
VRVHGTAGAVRVRPTGPVLAGVQAGRTLLVGDPPRPLEVVWRGGSDDRPLLRFAGAESREGAEGLTGAPLRVSQAELPEPPEDVFYVRDLVGCRIEAAGRTLGAVAEVLNRPANDVLQVATADGGELLVPFTADAVLRVDLPGRVVEVRPDLLHEGPPGG